MNVVESIFGQMRCGKTQALLLRDQAGDRVYHERNIAFLGMLKNIKFLNQADSDKNFEIGWYNDSGTDDDWVVIWCDLPTGEVSRHVPRELLDDLDWLENKKDSYSDDPYSTFENNKRLKEFLVDN